MYRLPTNKPNLANRAFQARFIPQGPSDRARISDVRAARKKRMILKYTLVTLLVGLLVSFLCFSYVMAKYRESIPAVRGKISEPRVNPGGLECYNLNSQYQKIKRASIYHIEDAMHLGGTDPKSVIYSEDGTKYIWKPQLPIKDGHYASAQNEVLFYFVDCMLHLKSTPPATVFSLPTSDLQHSLKKPSIEQYDERAQDWDKWVQQGFVIGTAQYFYPGVKHEGIPVETVKRFFRYLGMENLVFRLLGGNAVSEREMAQRDMIDFVTGNWDRNHNRFYIKNEVTKDTQLLYLDHNHLATASNCVPKFSLKYCKNWHQSVSHLREAVSGEGFYKKVADLLAVHEPDFNHGKREESALKCLDDRAKLYLKFVDDCIEKHGEHYVFVN